MPSYGTAVSTLTTEREDHHHDRMDEIDDEALNQAIKEADAISWVEVPLKRSLANLGSKINARYSDIYQSIENPNDAALFAKKWLWIASRHSQLIWHGWIAEGFCGNDERTQGYAATFEAGYSDLADAFYNHLASCKYSDAIQLQRPDWQWYQPLKAISLVWFCDADDLIESGNIAGSLDRMADAFSAIELMHGSNIFDDALKEGRRCSAAEVRAEVARNAALSLHSATTHVKRDAVIAYWRNNISAEFANELAADLLAKQFPDISHRTLTRYVSQAKKLPPASTRYTMPAPRLVTQNFVLTMPYPCKAIPPCVFQSKGKQTWVMQRNKPYHTPRSFTDCSN